MPLVINIGQRVIDKKKPQEHWHVSAEKAEVYRRLLPNEVKIIEDDKLTTPAEDDILAEDNVPVEDNTPVEGNVPVEDVNLASLGLDTPAGQVGEEAENDEVFG